MLHCGPGTELPPGASKEDGERTNLVSGGQLMSRLFPIPLLALLVIAPISVAATAPKPGEAVKGLELSIAVGDPLLWMNALKLRRATKNTPRYGCSQTTVAVTFTNVGKKPVKLDLYAAIPYGRLTLKATGPKADSVREQRLMIEYQMDAPTPRDYPTIQPGKSVTMPFKPRFPGRLGTKQIALMHPGVYELQAIYRVVPTEAPLRHAFQGGRWFGKVASNPVKLVAAPPVGEWQMGAAIGGKALAIRLPKHRYTVGDAITAKVALLNRTDKAARTIPLAMAGTFMLSVTGPDGRRIPYRGPMKDIEILPVTVKAGGLIQAEATLKWFDLSKPGLYEVLAVRAEGREPLESGRVPFLIVAKAEPAGDAAANDGRQGIRGTVIKLTGNHMPGPGPGGRGGRSALSVPVHVFRGPVSIFKKPNRKHPQLVQVVQSGKDGRFAVALPPGEYTVVAEINGELYLNLMQMDFATRKPVWGTARVKPGAWTTFNVVDSSGAAF
jgi:hypothetical protein